MIARLLISSSPDEIKIEVSNFLASHLSGVNLNHPDVLYFSADSKLGISEARKIKEHFSLKPFSAKGRAVILENAANLTVEAQNALLKTLEEPPKDALLILGASSEAKFLPTILSRCQIIKIQNSKIQNQNYKEAIEKLITATIEERFEFIEKLKDRENFLKSLTAYFHKHSDMQFLKELLKAEQWAGQNVNIRAILEYLMLVMPKQMW